MPTRRDPGTIFEFSNLFNQRADPPNMRVGVVFFTFRKSCQDRAAASICGLTLRENAA
jgi:hypothetical protein